MYMGIRSGYARDCGRFGCFCCWLSRPEVYRVSSVREEEH